MSAYYRDERSSEVERLARVGPPLTALGDGALQIEEEQVGLVGHGDDLVSEQLRGRDMRQPLRHAAAQHRVAGQRQRQRAGRHIKAS